MNYLSWILLGTLVSLVASDPIKGRKSSGTVTTETLVAKHKYPFQKHSVQTSDGYILELHRIPYSPRVNTSTAEPRPVVFFMHGLLSSSADWVMLGPDSLPFLLSDAGYDVWMGNARGNVYSRKHSKLNPTFKSFWNFDWHEIAMHDLPAMIVYVCDTTGQKQVTYFGHSQGTTTFFVLNSLDTKFKNRIKSAHLLAPVAFMKHLKSPVLQLSSVLGGLPNYSPEITGSMEFLPSSKIIESLGYTACSEHSLVSALCTNPLFLIAGFDAENLNIALLPNILATSPAGASMNQIYHFLQEITSGEFRQFDYGMVRNLASYKSVKPPNYPLEKIDVPIFLYYGKNDYLAAEVDVEKLITKLPKSSLKRAYRVEHPKWNHFDFVWGLNAQKQVYNTIMEDLASIQ